MSAHHDGKKQESSVGGDLLKGLAAAVAASLVLDRLDWLMWDSLSPQTRAHTRSVRPDGLDPAHVLARKAAHAMGTEIVPQGPDNQHPAGVAIHAAIGITAGVAYAMLRDRAPALAAGGGSLFGLGLFLVQDEGMNTLSGLGAPPQDYPWQAHARGVVAHVAYGVVLETTLRALNGPPGERRAGWPPAPSPASREGRSGSKEAEL